MGNKTGIYVSLPDGSEAERLFANYKKALKDLEDYLYEGTPTGELLLAKKEAKETDSGN